MDFGKLLEYQKVDLEYKKKNDEMAANPEYKKMRASKKVFDASKARMNECETAAANAVAAFKAASEYLAANLALMDELCTKIESESDEETEGKLLAELEALRAAIGEWEKKISQSHKNVDAAVGEYRTAVEKAKAAQAEYKNAKAKFAGDKARIDDELAEIKARRDKAEKDVDPELMKAYASVAAENNYPVLVMAMGDASSPSCGACGMALAQQTKTDLKNKGYCRCEACGRIIYGNY